MKMFLDRIIHGFFVLGIISAIALGFTALLVFFLNSNLVWWERVLIAIFAIIMFCFGYYEKKREQERSLKKINELSDSIATNGEKIGNTLKELVKKNRG